MTRVRLTMFTKESNGAATKSLSLGADAACAAILAEIRAFVKLTTFAREAIGTLALRCSGKRLSAYATILTG